MTRKVGSGSGLTFGSTSTTLPSECKNSLPRVDICVELRPERRLPSFSPSVCTTYFWSYFIPLLIYMNRHRWVPVLSKIVSLCTVWVTHLWQRQTTAAHFEKVQYGTATGTYRIVLALPTPTEWNMYGAETDSLKTNPNLITPFLKQDSYKNSYRELKRLS